MAKVITLGERGRKHKRRSLLCDIRLWHILERGGRLEREKEWEVISPAGRHPRETDLTHTGQKTSVERWSISLPQWKVERKFSQKNKMFREIFLWHGNESVRNKGGIASFCLRTPPKNLGVGDNWIGNVIKKIVFISINLLSIRISIILMHCLH